MESIIRNRLRYCEYELKCKDCAICLETFKLELLTSIDMMLMLEKVSAEGLLRQLNAMSRLTISI